MRHQTSAGDAQSVVREERELEAKDGRSVRVVASVTRWWDERSADDDRNERRVDESGGQCDGQPTRLRDKGRDQRSWIVLVNQRRNNSF